MTDYSKMTDEEFDRILTAQVSELTAGDILQIPGAYEVFSEHFNNAVLDEWRSQKEMEAEEAANSD